MATAATCQTCVYAYWDPRRRLSSLPAPFPPGPMCANHPDRPGVMRPVPAGGACRNYRPKPATPAEDVKRIPVAGGWYAYVDADNFEWLSQHKWSCQNGYAARRGKGKTIFMHRQIMRTPKGMVVDHIDGNKMNNCRMNMRNCTPQQNRLNQAKHIGATSRFKGVYYYKRIGKYCAAIRHNGVSFWLGYFDEEVEAARAYNHKAAELFGIYARLNFPEEWPPERRARVYRQHQAAARKEGRTKEGKSHEAQGDARRGGRKHAQAALGRGTRTWTRDESTAAK